MDNKKKPPTPEGKQLERLLNTNFKPGSVYVKLEVHSAKTKETCIAKIPEEQAERMIEQLMAEPEDCSEDWLPRKVKEGVNKEMTKEQFEHVEEKLVEFVDHVVESCKTKRATSAEVEALPKVALALVEMHQFPRR